MPENSLFSGFHVRNKLFHRRNCDNLKKPWVSILSSKWLKNVSGLKGMVNQGFTMWTSHFHGYIPNFHSSLAPFHRIDIAIYLKILKRGRQRENKYFYFIISFQISILFSPLKNPINLFSSNSFIRVILIVIPDIVPQNSELKSLQVIRLLKH